MHDYLSATDLYLEDLNPLLSANTHEDGAEIEWTEPLEFHREFADDGPLAELFDEDGWLTTEAEHALRMVVLSRYGALVDLEGGDDPHFRLLWDVEGTTAEEINEAAWPLAAKIANETDPGTYGAAYLMALVYQEYIK